VQEGEQKGKKMQEFRGGFLNQPDSLGRRDARKLAKSQPAGSDFSPSSKVLTLRERKHFASGAETFRVTVWINGM